MEAQQRLVLHTAVYRVLPNMSRVKVVMMIVLWLPSLLQCPTSKHNQPIGTPNIGAAGRNSRQGWQAEQKQTMIAVYRIEMPQEKFHLMRKWQ